MKKILYICFSLCLTAVLLASCKDEEMTDKRVTNYATLSLTGDEYIIMDKGAQYAEPGYTAVMAGKDATDQVKVTSNLNVNASGVYTINYEITNADGFSSTASRTVCVLDPNNPVEGFYEVLPGSYREYNGKVVKFSGYEILIYQREDGNYYFSDLFGGYYDQRAGYGSNYAMTGNIKICEDNSLQIYEGYVAGWGDGPDGFEGTYDPDTQSFSFVTGYNGGTMFFHVNMQKEEI